MAQQQPHVNQRHATEQQDGAMALRRYDHAADVASARYEIMSDIYDVKDEHYDDAHFHTWNWVKTRCPTHREFMENFILYHTQDQIEQWCFNVEQDIRGFDDAAHIANAKHELKSLLAKYGTNPFNLEKHLKNMFVLFPGDIENLGDYKAYSKEHFENEDHQLNEEEQHAATQQFVANADKAKFGLYERLGTLRFQLRSDFLDVMDSIHAFPLTHDTVIRTAAHYDVYSRFFAMDASTLGCELVLLSIEEIVEALGNIREFHVDCIRKLLAAVPPDGHFQQLGKSLREYLEEDAQSECTQLIDKKLKEMGILKINKASKSKENKKVLRSFTSHVFDDESQQWRDIIWLAHVVDAMIVDENLFYMDCFPHDSAWDAKNYKANVDTSMEKQALKTMVVCDYAHRTYYNDYNREFENLARIEAGFTYDDNTAAYNHNAQWDEYVHSDQ